ncbi:hypothetical protein SISSUDRAFT_604416 [Sistotremastrum suecicum HHB10207 ss-3]|uniref:Uncharacterized protein n=1 Tax=Sistotremastrum suecicum HHB10207 ss-3 TaxID=1314776 RepID=A0A166IAC2_9AGAM|nr:hypothetical protein SISSUDRAFT_604416 [Sistotremastrum suecicum HHB10207 ss-3]
MRFCLCFLEAGSSSHITQTSPGRVESSRSHMSLCASWFFFPSSASIATIVAHADDRTCSSDRDGNELHNARCISCIALAVATISQQSLQCNHLLL